MEVIEKTDPQEPTMYLTHDVQTALRTADQHQTDLRAACSRRRVRAQGRRLGRAATPTSPTFTPSPRPRRGTPAPA